MRPIDADELMQKYCGRCNFADDDKVCPNCKYYEFRARIKAAPTIQPKWKQGRWIYNEKLRCFQCSECGKHNLKGEDSFCRSCGAKMDGGADNG